MSRSSLGSHWWYLCPHRTSHPSTKVILDAKLTSITFAVLINDYDSFLQTCILKEASLLFFYTVHSLPSACLGKSEKYPIISGKRVKHLWIDSWQKLVDYWPVLKALVIIGLLPIPHWILPKIKLIYRNIWVLLQSHLICPSLAMTSYGYCYCVSSFAAWLFAFIGPSNIGLLYCLVPSLLFPKASFYCNLHSNGRCIRWLIIWNSVPFL